MEVVSAMNGSAGDDDGEVGVVVVTHRAVGHLRACLEPLLASPLRKRILVVNSGGNDGTVELARELGAEVMAVERTRFNHGLTREEARRHLGTPVTVFLSPDAYPQGPGFLERLVEPIRAGRAQIAYARQVARAEADLLERTLRGFNYPAQSHVRGEADRQHYGSYTHFCSNAAAAWSSAALDAVGGFRPGLVSEETVATALILAGGGRIAYVADAIALHSHTSSAAALFRRQFDVGYTRTLWRDLLLARGRDEERGRRFAASLLRQAWREEPAGLPRLGTQLAAMWLGYRLGRLGSPMPAALAKRLSGQDFYWTSKVRAEVRPGGALAA